MNSGLFMPYMKDRRIALPGGDLTDPFRPDPIMPVENLAATLANICRWGGRCRPFYSVAQHSALIALYLLDNDYGPDIALTALMHDAGEAYLMDVSAPVKSTPEFAAMKCVEHDLEAYILPLYGASYPLPAIVDEVDKRISHNEALALGLAGNWLDHYPEPLDITISPLEPKGACELFLSTHSTIIDMQNGLSETKRSVFTSISI